MNADAARVESVAFSVDELGALAELLGATAYPGTPQANGSMPAIARQAAGTAARRSLIARGVVELGATGPQVAEAFAELVTVPLAAQLAIAVERRDRTQTYVRHYYTDAASAVEHGLRARGVHQLTRFPARDVAKRVLEFAELTLRSSVEAAPFKADADAFALLRAGVQIRDLAQARDTLGEVAAPFVNALEEFLAWCRVTVVRRGDELILGGETTWIDTSIALWRLEPDTKPGGEVAVTISPSTARAIADAVVDHLVADGSATA